MTPYETSYNIASTFMRHDEIASLVYNKTFEIGDEIVYLPGFASCMPDKGYRVREFGINGNIICDIIQLDLDVDMSMVSKKWTAIQPRHFRDYALLSEVIDKYPQYFI